MTVEQHGCNPLLITIDGPAGAGKTTVSKALAERLGFRYIDTGALYRAVAYEIIARGIDPEDSAALELLCESLELQFVRTPAGVRLLSGEKDITDAIRTPQITMLASAASAKPVVRRTLLDIQRRLGAEKAAVFEGRDMGTVVFPDADLKFFLTADLSTRARRRFEEFKATNPQSLEDVCRDMAHRDENDSSRALAPLKPADDAVRIDSTGLEIDAVIERMLVHVGRAGGKN